MKKKNKILVSIVAVVVILLVIGVSYALWIITKEQNGENVVNTSCLDVTIENEADDISNSTFNRGFLGDATKEIGPFQSIQYDTQSRQIGSWYNDESWFLDSISPWFLRGGIYDEGTGAGLFNFGSGDGFSHSWISFRLVLVF